VLGTREEGPYQNTFGIRPRLAQVQVANSDATKTTFRIG
jgi:hypothetical protein